MSDLHEPEITVKTNLDVATRKFIPDPNGREIGYDGRRGSYGEWEIQKVHNLMTTAGRDFLHQQGYATSGLGANGGNYIALTTDATAASAADTTLTGEIVTTGLERAQGAVTHVAGNTTSTISKTFTATGTHTSVQKCALFTAASAGTMLHEATFVAASLLSNDQIAITWTVTLS